MGKVVKGALKVVGAVAAVASIVATAGTALGFVAAGSSLFGLGVSAAAFSAIAAGTALATGLLGGTANVPQSEVQLGRLYARLDTQAPRKIVLGPDTAFPADIRYYEGSGEDEEYVDYVIALAAHRIGTVKQIWFEDELAWSSAAGVQGDYVGYLSNVTVRTEGNAANTIGINGGARWGSDDRLTGCAYLRLRVKRTGNSDSEQSPLASGLPGRVTIIGDGMPMYDPRYDSTVGGSGSQRIDDQATWGPSSGNLVIQALNVLIGWRINGRLSVGAGLPAKYLDLDSAITAANICDEPINLSTGGTQPRYRGAGAFSTDDSPMNIVTALLAGCAGDLLDSEGRLSFLIKANTLAMPAVTFDDHDVVSGAQWDPMGGKTNVPNIISGSYVDPGALFQLAPYPSVEIASEDGIDRTAPVDFGVVENAPQAERLGKQTLQRMQYPGTFTAEYNMKGMAAKVGRIVWQTYSPRGWVDKPFRVVSQRPSRSGRIALVLREEHASIYAWEAEDSAAVQPAEPVRFDPRNAGPVLLARKAAQTADWPKVTDSENTKPEDNATVGAPSGTPVGDRTADEVTGAIDQHETELTTNEANIAAANAAIAAAEQEIDDLFATYGSTESAAQSATAALDAKAIAEAARDTALAAEANAAQANADAQSAKAASQSARDTAVAKASEAGGYASTAESHKDDAAGSATTATAQATVATTKAGEASTSASEASTSEINAAGSASSAAADAALAAVARNEAGGFADAAAESESVASAKATEASQSASSATTAANTATTKAGEASASAGRAAISESNAEDAATSASSFATLSASYRDQSLDNATKAGSSLAFNDEFEIVGGWYSGSGQTGEFGVGDYTDTSRGRAIRGAIGSRMTLVGKRIAVDPTRAYRISIDYYCVGANQETHVGFAAYDRDGLVLSGNSGTHTYSVLVNARPAANQWFQDSAVVQSEGSGHQNFPDGTRYIAPFAYLNYDGEAGARTIVNSFRVDDATETVAAGNSAEAAATSASTATVRAGEAATSATSASNAANTATNKAGEASTSSNAAAASATTASTKAGEASASAATALLSEVEAQKSVAVTLPQLSPETLHAFASLFNGDLVANYDTGVLPVGDSLNYWGSDSEGQFYRRAITSSQTFADVAFRKAVKIEPGRTYRATARGRYANYGGGTGGDVRLYFVYLDENQDYIGSNNYSVIGRSGSWSEITLEKSQSQMPANAAYLRAFYRFSSSGHSPYCVHDLLFITFEDVTNKNAAAASAAAASSSATSASADAATASSAKNLAVTYRDQASSSATAAAASATSASNDASAASTSATLAATYRDTAERFSEPSLGLNRNSEFDHIGTWSGVHNYSNHSSGPGAKSNSGQGMTLFGNKFPVDTSQAYEVSIRLWALDGDARHYVGFAAYDASGNVLPGNTGTHTYTAASSFYTPSQSWVVYSGRMQGEGSGGQKFPAGTKYIAPMAYINYQANSSGYVWVDWFRITNVDGLAKAEAQATIATDQAAIATAEAAAASSNTTLAATYRDEAKEYATGGVGLNFNGQFEVNTGWYTTHHRTTAYPASQYYSISRGRAIRSDANARTDMFGELLPINPDLAYKIRAKVFANTGQRQYAGYVAFDRYKNRIGSSGYYYPLMNHTQLARGVWTDVASPVITGDGSGADKFPAGTMYIALCALMNYNSDNGYTYYSDFTIDEVTDVNALEASVVTNAAVLATQVSTLASLQTTVSAQGASINSYATAISGINGDLDALFAKAGVRIDVNGRVTGWEANDNGSESSFRVRSDSFEVEPSTSSGPRTQFKDGSWRIYAGTIMTVWGTGFGSAGQFIEWTGPAQDNLANCTESNAVKYVRTDGSAYFGGGLSSGVLQNSGTATIVSPTASVVVGPFASNGRTININVSATYLRKQNANSGTGSISGSGSGTLVVETSTNGGASWTSRGTFGVNENIRQIISDGDPAIPDQITWGMAAASTVTWQPGAVTNLMLRVRWTARSEPTISGTGLTPPVITQTTSGTGTEQP